MSKYKVGDKVVMDIGKYEGFYGISDNLNPSLIHWYRDDDLDRYTEPLSTYTEPLEAKMRRQAAEITRLLEENKRLKAENRNSPWNIEQARAKGAEAAWELVRKIVYTEENGGYTYAELKEIFGIDYSKQTFEYTYQEAATKVEAWEKAKVKPQKTILQDFLEKFPKAELNSQGTPYGICPSYLGYKNPKCNFGCVECWNRPLEQIGGEE